MNKLAANIPNKIKQPALCCIHCGKSYIKRANLDKHLVICELLQISKTKTKTSTNLLIDSLYNDENETMPTQKKMFQMLIELGERYNKLEEKVEEMNKWVVKKKKKINVLEWLNAHMRPNMVFDDLHDKIVVIEQDIQNLFEHSYYDVMNDVFSRNIYNFSDNENPLFAFVQKQNVFYIYDAANRANSANNDTNIWVELTKERLTKFLNKLHTKVFKAFCDWKNIKKTEIKADERLSNLCDKTFVKLMSVEFKQENIYVKARNAMYSRMKKDMKELIEYDFEF
jgi:uncharacterized protein YeeX (DUF496 family)